MIEVYARGAPAHGQREHRPSVRASQLRRGVSFFEAGERSALGGAEAEDLEDGLGVAERTDDAVAGVGGAVTSVGVMKMDSVSARFGPFGAAFVTPPPPGPEDQIEALIDDIEALIAGGDLRQNQGATLINKLERVLAKLDGGQIGAACNQLGAFIIARGLHSSFRTLVTPSLLIAIRMRSA